MTWSGRNATELVKICGRRTYSRNPQIARTVSVARADYGPPHARIRRRDDISNHERAMPAGPFGEADQNQGAFETGVSGCRSQRSRSDDDWSLRFD